MPAFSEGDRVAWDHGYAPDHAEGSIVLAEAVAAKAPDAKFGTVTAVANDVGTYFDVALDSGETWTLTNDELVKVSGDPPAPEAPAEPVAEAPADPAPDPAPEAAPDA